MHCPTLNELPPPPPGKTGWPWMEESPQLPDTMPDGSPWPRVSIVTPSYNQGQFIEETIRSVLLQGYPNLEYIIVDGGSSDNSVDIIRKYEPWLAYWVSEPDRGQSHAINKGWKLSRGHILAYLNSDDVLEPEVLHKVVKAFSDWSDMAVVYGDCYLVDSKRHILRRLKSQEYNRANLLLADYIHQSSTFVRRAAVQVVGLFDESLHMCMDYDYWVRLAIAGCMMRYVPEVFSSQRLTPDAKSVSQSIHFLGDHLRILNKVYGCPDVPDDVRWAKRDAYANAWRLGGVRYFDAHMRHSAMTAMLNSLRWNPLPGWKPLALMGLIILQSIVGLHWRSAHTLDKVEAIS